jgi:hypothetical protein
VHHHNTEKNPPPGGQMLIFELLTGASERVTVMATSEQENFPA